MERSRLICSVLLALGFIFATTRSVEASEVPRLVTYQGLIPGGGNDQVNITINFYKQFDTPDPLFSETHTNVQLNDGVFSILLGSQAAGGLSSGLFVSSEAIGISIDGGDELKPQIVLTMVPFVDRATGSETLVRSNSDRVVMRTLNSNTVQVIDSSGNVQFEFRTDAVNSAGEFKMFNATGTETVEILGGSGSDGSGLLTLRRADGSVGATIAANAGLLGTSMGLWSPTGDQLVSIQGFTTGGRIDLRDGAGIKTVTIESQAGTGGAQIILENASGIPTVNIDGSNGGNGFIAINEAAGQGRLFLSGGNINGGSDLSEQFDIKSEITTKPGMVVSIDPENPGKLEISTRAYDRRVAGIVSGAGGVKPGMLMGQRGTIADGAHAVALTGRVWCYVDAGFGSIEPGDLLTTSNTPGHAMKVLDHTNANGAIIGKAMTSLKSNKGLVLVLVSLQ